MKLLGLLALAGGWVCTLQANPVKLLGEHKSGPIRYSVQVGELEEEAFTAAAIGLLAPPEVKFGRVVRYASEAAALVVERASRLTGCSWEALVTDAVANDVRIPPERCPEVMEAIKIGSSIVRRSVDAKCRVKKELIAGTSDPLWIEIGSAHHEVLALQVRKREGVGRKSHEVKLSAQLFVRTKVRLSTELAKAILEQISSLCPMEDLFVILRNDAAFFGSCMFPSPYLFDGPKEGWEVGSKPQIRGEEAACGVFESKPVSCWHRW